MEKLINLKKNELDQLFGLAKYAGFSLKQLDQTIPGLPISYLKNSWHKYLANRPGNHHVVQKRHKAEIIELILYGINIFYICWIFEYHPHTVLKFIEGQSAYPEWKIIQCTFCKNRFVAIKNENSCTKLSCKKEKKKRYDKKRWNNRQHFDF